MSMYKFGRPREWELEKLDASLGPIPGASSLEAAAGPNGHIEHECHLPTLRIARPLAKGTSVLRPGIY
jgi:hypothetical protein